MYLRGHYFQICAKAWEAFLRQAKITDLVSSDKGDGFHVWGIAGEVDRLVPPVDHVQNACSRAGTEQGAAFRGEAAAAVAAVSKHIVASHKM